MVVAVPQRFALMHVIIELQYSEGLKIKHLLTK